MTDEQRDRLVIDTLWVVLINLGFTVVTLGVVLGLVTSKVML